ncbi:MAG TPA: thiamine pyrophosphate-dependent enzyme, partial [Gemmatimonadaceae bacterium]|nr:thiamine pyrophosphate-dependent enzyme [Gemmatimonadaceae bacterium]
MSTEARKAPAPASKRKEPGQPSNNGADAPSASDLATTTPEIRRELLHSMMLQRRFEERCAEAYALGKIGGFCHLYIGQEAISAGVMSMIRP